MIKYCKYCYEETKMELVEGEYWECSQCNHGPLREIRDEEKKLDN